MPTLFRLALLALVIFLELASDLQAHGGQYRAPFAPPGRQTPGPAPHPGVVCWAGPLPLERPNAELPLPPGYDPPRLPGVPNLPTSRPKEEAIDRWDAWWFFHDDRFLAAAADRRARRRTSDKGRRNSVFTLHDRGLARLAAWGNRRRILPVLERACRDPYFDVRAAAVIALARTGPPECLADIRALMSDEDWRVRESSLLAMGILGNTEARPTLAAVMTDTLSARGLMGQPDGIDRRARVFAALALGLIGAHDHGLSAKNSDAPLLALIAEETNPRELDLQIAATLALGLMKSRDALPELVRLLGDEKRAPWARAYAASSLGEIGDRGALAALVNGLRNQDPAVVQSCVMSLGRLAEAHDLVVSEELQKLTQSGDLGIRHFSLMSLAEIGGTSNRDILVRLCRSSSEVTRPFAALALGVHFARNPGDPEQEHIARELLLAFKTERNQDLRAALATALGLMDHQEAGADISAALTACGRASLRGPLCIALGLLGWEGGRAEIRRSALELGDLDLRRNAVLALGLLGGEESARDLWSLLEATENSIVVHGAAAQGLALAGVGDAISSMIDCLEDRPSNLDMTRAFSATTLGLLGAREEEPLLSSLAWFINYHLRDDAVAELLTIL